MMDIYETKVALAKKLPPVYCNIEKPKMNGYFNVELNTWDTDKDDYVQVVLPMYFDGTEFYTTDLYNWDRTDWISNWCYFTIGLYPNESDFWGSEAWEADVKKGWRSTVIPEKFKCKEVN